MTAFMKPLIKENETIGTMNKSENAVGKSLVQNLEYILRDLSIVTVSGGKIRQLIFYN